MTFRFSKRLSPLLFLTFGLGAATTAQARDNDESASSDDTPSSKQSRKADGGDSDRASQKDDDSERTSGESEDNDGWRDPTPKSSKKQHASAKVEAAPSSTTMSIGLLGSYGPSSDYTRGGLGLRGGLHLDDGVPLYFGVLGTYFFGNKQTAEGAFGEPGSSTTKGFMYFGGEAGIDIQAMRDVTMRPNVGLGVGRSSNERCGGDGTCTTKAEYPLTITPGIIGLYDVGASLFVGADVRFLIAAGAQDVSGPILSATVGFKF